MKHPKFFLKKWATYFRTGQVSQPLSQQIRLPKHFVQFRITEIGKNDGPRFVVGVEGHGGRNPLFATVVPPEAVGFVHDEKVQAHLSVNVGDLERPHGLNSGGFQQLHIAGRTAQRKGAEEPEQVPSR